MYNTMKKELVSAITRIFPESTQVITFETFKNGKKVEAFSIREEHVNTSPTFYFHHYYEAYCKNVSIENIVAEIVDLYHFANQQLKAPLHFYEFETQKDKICYKLVNTKEYEAQLPSIPHVDFFDLSIIFYGILKVEDEGLASYTITNDILDSWNIDKETIYKLAFANTPRVLPVEIADIFSAMCGAYDTYETIDEAINNLDDEQILYMVSNSYKVNGFTSILYPDLLKKFGERFGNFYILPSSIQEALFVPEQKGMDINYMKDMVKSVNRDVVCKEDFLSNSVYYYNTSTEKIDAFLG